MTVRSKFQLVAVTAFFGTESKELKFRSVYDPSLPEDVRFQKFSPWGEFTQHVDNPAALAELTLGGFYYFDINPVPAADPVPILSDDPAIEQQAEHDEAQAVAVADAVEPAPAEPAVSAAEPSAA